MGGGYSTLKNKGFTLIELLAVIVILAIIATIAVPIVLNLIEQSRKNAFKDSVYGIMEAADLFVVSENYNPNDEIEFVCDGASCSLDDGRQLSFKGDVPISGSIQIKDKNTLAYFIKSNEYCALGTKENLDVNKDCTKLDYTKAEIELNLVKSTTNSVIVSFEATDIESGISNVEVKLNDDVKNFEYEKSPIVTSGEAGIVFDKLESNKEYTVTLTVTNGNYLTETKDLKVSTKEMKNPDLVSINDPTEAQDGYFKTQTIKITFDKENVSETTKHYVKTTKEGTSSIGVTKRCGNIDDTDTPDVNKCETINSTTTLAANVWYEIDGDLDVKYDKTDKTTDKNLYAITYDGTNYSNSSTYTLSKIDGTKPTLEMKEIISKTDKLSIGYTATDDESGIETRTCKYGTTQSNLDKEGAITDTNCGLTKLNPKTTYYYKICVTDKVGNEEVCKEGHTDTQAFINPKLDSVISPTTAVSGFVKTQSITATFNNANIENPNHYIKTTREGTASDNVTESCGSEDNPGNCTSITGTTTLSANTWYKVNGTTITVKYDKASTATGDTLTAITYDGTNYSGVATYTLSKIDATNPTFTMNTATSTTNSISIPYTASDSETGVNVTCKYGTTNGNYGTSGSLANNTCTLSGLKAGTTYYYQMCASDGVGNEATCQTSSFATKSITAPSITLTTNTAGTVANYALKQVAAVTFNKTNVTSPTYYIKTTKTGTSSLGVTQSCGNGTTPGTCSNVTSTTTLSANLWYKVSGNVNVTYSTPSTATGTLSAITYDGTNYSTAASQAISMIEQSATSISLNKTSATIKEGETTTLTATISPTTTTNKNVTWSTNNANVATVSGGTVTGKGVGTATITAKTANNQSTTATITVQPKGELLYGKVSVGDYVAYDAGKWGAATDIPTYSSSVKFGGNAANTNKGMSAKCYNSTTLNGWRVLKKENNQVTIVHAGQPECHFHYYSEMNAITLLNNRAKQYMDSTYAESAHAMTRDEAKAITGDERSTDNDLRDIGAFYWLASISSESVGMGYDNLYLFYVNGAGGINEYGNGVNEAYGFRPVVVLKSNVLTSGQTTDQFGNAKSWTLVGLK